jgi:hypothetical protein
MRLPDVQAQVTLQQHKQQYKRSKDIQPSAKDAFDGKATRQTAADNCRMQQLHVHEAPAAAWLAASPLQKKHWALWRGLVRHAHHTHDVVTISWTGVQLQTTSAFIPPLSMQLQAVALKHPCICL